MLRNLPEFSSVYEAERRLQNFREEVRTISVKKNKRKASKTECLLKARELVYYVLTITKPRIQQEDGKYTKAGVLGTTYFYHAFGNDLFESSKAVHANALAALDIRFKNKKQYEQRRAYLERAVQYCNSMLRVIDLCKFEPNLQSKRRRKAVNHLANLVYETKKKLNYRIENDRDIFQNQQSGKYKRKRNRNKK